jgi:hypothetical protein
MDELVAYLSVLEERVNALEQENHQLRMIMPQEILTENTISKTVSKTLPKSNVISRSFLARAFAIWGHFMVANLMIGFIFLIIYFCLVLFLFRSHVNP